MTVNDIALGIDERQVVESCGPPAERKSLGLEVLLYYEPCPTVIIDAGRRVLKVLGGDRLRLAGGESLGQDSTIPDLIGCIGPPAGRLIEDETWYYPALRIRVRFAKRGIIYCLGEDPPGPL
ncbi:MAG: hypothetical protein KC910_35170, partial [Candidatus Eremiobacteraeota bacterium]|nr:hypothetical protein [Candidatus Eremiobacteraeota bacterium]